MNARSLLIFCCFGFLWLAATSWGTAQTELIQHRKTSSDIRCTIHVDNSFWKPSRPAIVRVKIENVTEGSLEVRVSPTLSLSSVPSNADRDKYWAPVDLQRDGPLGIAKQPMGKKGDVLAIRAVPIKVSFDNKAQALEFSIDARHASWAKEISEVWPSRDLFATVNPGMYDLRLLLESDTGDCESGSVPVLIEKAGPGKSKP